jgi:nitronate monooxygenase
MAFDFRDLSVPILVAPMAGGPSTPALAAAGTNAGGLGFVAAGYLTPEVFAARLAAARGLTSARSVRICLCHSRVRAPGDIERYAKALAPEAERRRPAR